MSAKDTNRAAHTPGPWSIPHFAQPEVNCECGYVLTEQFFGAVCTVHCSGDGNDWQKNGDNPKFAEACANARLIAAAPELLAALERILQLNDQMPLEHPSRLSHGEENQARAAIKKARGE